MSGCAWTSGWSWAASPTKSRSSPRRRSQHDVGEPRHHHRLGQGHQHAAQRPEPVHVRLRGAGRARRFVAPEHQLPAVRQRRHGRLQRQRRRRRRQPLPARRRVEHEQRGQPRQPRLRALARRRAGSAGRHQHLRRPVRPDRRRHGERQREERHQPALGHRFVHAPRQEPEPEPLSEHPERHPEDGTRSTSTRFSPSAGRSSCPSTTAATRRSSSTATSS